MVPDDDRGLLLGDGLFETLLAEDGRLRFWDEHLARMARGCAVIGLAPPDPEAAMREANAALAAAGLGAGQAVVRVTLTAGSGRGLDRPNPAASRLIVTASQAPASQGTVTLAIAGVRRNDASPAARVKSLSYLDNVLARRQARELGADEALMLNTRGEMACAAAANLFWIADDRLFTPALECGVLAGITRARVIEAARALRTPVAEVREGMDSLRTAQAVFLTGSLIGVRPASALDGRPLGGSRLVEALSSRCR